MASGKNVGRFEPLENPGEVLPILKSRLPLSANIYNCAKMYAKWSPDVKWFILNGDASENAWILMIGRREDYGQEISVSRPPTCEISDEVKEALCSFDGIDWDGTFCFCAVDQVLSMELIKINVQVKGLKTNVHPNILFAMDIEKAVKLDTNFKLEENLELKSLDNEEGKSFLLSQWKYAIDGTAAYLQKCLSRNPSAGVYYEGSPVSGVTVVGHGTIGMLNTLETHRQKGYAKYCMLTIMKTLGQEGLVPVCTVEVKNTRSRAFQTKVGFEAVGVVDFIVGEKSNF